MCGTSSRLHSDGLYVYFVMFLVYYGCLKSVMGDGLLYKQNVLTYLNVYIVTDKEPECLRFSFWTSCNYSL
jgi:hypothetical protein